MGDSDLQLPHNLEDAERFQRLFVQPMIAAVTTEMRTTCETLKKEFAADREAQSQLRTDVDSLKSNQKKALVGWGVFASAASIVVGFFGNKARNKIGL